MALTSTVSALTREKFMPVLVDNIFNSNALCLKLLKNADKLDGGVKINVPVETAQNGNSDWLADTGLTATAQAMTDIAEKAVYSWATAYNSINISQNEIHMNQGSNQVLSMLKAKMKNAEKTIRNLFGTGMFATSVVTNGLNTLNGRGTYDGGETVAHAQAHDNGIGLIHDLSPGTFADGLWLPEGGEAESIVGYDRTLAGITSGTPGDNDFWNANLGTFEFAIGTVGGLSGAAAIDESNDTGDCNFAAFCSTTSGVAGGIKAMTQMYGACSIDGDQPDLIVTTQVIYDAYETALQANKRWAGDATLADAGFQSLQFKGATVVVDSHCPAEHMYFLNTRYLDFKVHSKRNFAFEDFKPQETRDVLQARIFWMGQLVCSNPRMQGLLVGGPTGY